MFNKWLNKKTILMTAGMGSILVPTLRFAYNFLGNLPAVFSLEDKENIFIKTSQQTANTLIMDYCIGLVFGAVIGSLDNFKKVNELEFQETITEEKVTLTECFKEDNDESYQGENQLNSVKIDIYNEEKTEQSFS